MASIEARGVRGAASLIGAGALPVVRKPVAFLLAALALSLLLGYGATRVVTDTSVALLADTNSRAYQDQAAYADAFGADPVVLVVEPKQGQQLLTPDHLVGIAALEGRLSTAHGVKRVYGPGTLVNTFATEVTKRALDLCGSEGTAAQTQAAAAAAAAGKSAAEQQSAGQSAFDGAVRACAQRLAAQYPTLGAPALNNPSFYNEVLLEPGGQQARPFWAWALPDPQHAVIQVRMDRNASVSDVNNVLDRISLGESRKEMAGLQFTTTGAPVLSASLAQSVLTSLRVLVPFTLAAMLLVTLFVIRVPLRLLAVPLSALAGFWAYGAAGLLGVPLTPATLAVLPVVLGLTTDYTLQAANRLAEETGTPAERLSATAAAILPATGLAALATLAGVLAFWISPIPLVRQFALFMAIGVASAYLVSLVCGLPLMALGLRRGSRPAGRATPPSWERLAGAARLPLGIVAPVAVVGLIGWAALPFIQIETDPGKLMPAGSGVLAATEHVRQSVHLVGELDLVLTGGDVTSPEAVAWLGKAERRAQDSAHGGLRDLTSLAGFLVAFNNGGAPDPATTKLILDRIPQYFTGAVVSGDHHLARAVFGIPNLTSVQDDRALVADLQGAGAGAPPAGLRAYPAGLAVIAADALTRLQAEAVWLNLAALGLVLLVLGLAYLRPLTALVAVAPTAVAAGWATGIMYVSGEHASPITVLLAGVVVAFATEFSVLWLSRYRAERRGGQAALEAAETASRRVGPAIVASAAALVAGFGVLALPFASVPPMLRDFGLWSALDLALATISVLLLLPPLARRVLR